MTTGSTTTAPDRIILSHFLVSSALLVAASLWGCSSGGTDVARDNHIDLPL